MATVTFDELPTRINVSIGLGSSWGPLITINQDMSGHTFSGAVVKGSVETALTITVISLSPTTQIRPSLTPTQVTALGPGVYHWYIKYVSGSTARRAFAGDFGIEE